MTTKKGTVNNEKKLLEHLWLKKKGFSTVYQFWKQQFFNQNESGLVVKVVKYS